MMKFISSIIFFGLLMIFVSCTVQGEETLIEPNFGIDSKLNKNNAEQKKDSLMIDSSSFFVKDSVLYNSVEWVKIKDAAIIRSSVEFSVNDYKISSTEVTQGIYFDVMKKIPNQEKKGDEYPVVNVTWYDAILFCNEFSKRLGVDTIYEYKKEIGKDYLSELNINYSLKGFRLPTETEWEIASHGGSTEIYYWGTSDASKYAYYAQSKGPSEVGKLIANEFGLYDMAGNVAEWVNDWYGEYPKSSVKNPIGPKTGDYRIVRGGGWSSVVKDIAPNVREKKDPQYKSLMLGFRIVYSEGF